MQYTFSMNFFLQFIEGTRIFFFGFLNFFNHFTPSFSYYTLKYVCGFNFIPKYYRVIHLKWKYVK